MIASILHQVHSILGHLLIAESALPGCVPVARNARRRPALLRAVIVAGCLIAAPGCGAQASSDDTERPGADAGTSLDGSGGWEAGTDAPDQPDSEDADGALGPPPLGDASTDAAETSTAWCGDGVCSNGESCSNCASDCGACPPSCGNGVCEDGESCSNCASDCGTCPPTVTHETEFLTWNLYNNAGCTSSNGVAMWHDRDNGPGPLSIRDTLLTQDPAILALQEDGELGPASCSIGTVKDQVASWLAGTHDVRSTDDVSGSAAGERYGIFIKKAKYRFIAAGYQRCYYDGSEVRGFLWAEVDLLSDSTSNHFYVLNTHFKAHGTSADIAERRAQAECVIQWVLDTKVSHPYRTHFLLGDLNSGPDHQDEAYVMLTGASGPFENTSTAGPNDIDTHGTTWIDHVLGTKGDFTKAGYGSWTVGAGQVQNGGTLSDHLGLRTRIGHLR